jgi:L-threonylcarbamoyladenylate synthase
MAEVIAASGSVPDASVVARAAEVLRTGALLIYPTDTLYALGGRATDDAAALAVRAAKGRDSGKPLPVIVASERQARALCLSWPQGAERLAAAFWPGPLSLVLPAGPDVPDGVTAGTRTVALRVPALALARAIAAAAGALVATSANVSGQPAPLSCAEAVEQVGFAAALALDAGLGNPLSSTLVDLTGDEPRLLREGPVSWADVARALAGRIG